MLRKPHCDVHLHVSCLSKKSAKFELHNARRKQNAGFWTTTFKLWFIFFLRILRIFRSIHFTAKKCNKVYSARAELLLYSSNPLFREIVSPSSSWFAKIPYYWKSNSGSWLKFILKQSLRSSSLIVALCWACERTRKYGTAIDVFKLGTQWKIVFCY